MADYTELYVDQGTTFNYTLTLNDDVTNANVNISGYTIVSTVKKSYYSANITANMVVTIVDSANGVFNVALDAGTTSNIAAGRYVFDVKYDTGSIVVRALEGTMSVYPGVS